MRHVATLTAASLAALALAGCATTAPRDSVKFAAVKDPVSFNQQERDYDAAFAGRPAVQRVRVPGGLFISRPMEDQAPSSLLSKRIEFSIRSEAPALSDLQTLLDAQGVDLTIDWHSLQEAASSDKDEVGSFTAASKYQDVANSVNGGSGLQGNNSSGNGYGSNTGSSYGSTGSSYGSTGNYGSTGSYGSNSSSGGNPNIKITGSAQGGSGNGNGGSGGSGSFGGGFGTSGGNVVPSVGDTIPEESDDRPSVYDCGQGGSSSGSSGTNYSTPTISGGRTNPSGNRGSGSSQRASSGPCKRDARISPRFYDRPLPFRYFKGTVGELIRRLQNSGNIAVWYDGGLVVGDFRRYSIAVMQNQDIVQSIVNELVRLGAKHVMGSVGAGQIFYSAPPRTNGEIIEPYLRRLQGNLSEVTMQMALVTVSMSRSAEHGFDWSQFNVQFGSASTTSTTSTTGTSTTGTTTGSTGASAGSASGNGLFSLSSSNFGITTHPSIFGTKNPLTISGAIRYLSQMGNTSVAQNVELRTLSGSPVILRSGEDIPYVTGVGNSYSGGLSSTVSGEAQTARLGTGLTVNVLPRYDSTSGIVTMDVALKLVDLVQFVQLNAGNQLGTLTQPETREQGLNSILRLSAGETAILGGIRRDLASDTRTGAFDNYNIGSRTRDREVFWLFALVRPVVTVYETADAPTVTRSTLDTRTTVNPYDEGSYGAPGVPRETTSISGDPQVPSDSGTPTFYRQRGSTTPGNHIPAGVAVSATPAPRDIVVPGAQTPLEVTGSAPEGSVVRDPGSPDSVARAPINKPYVGRTPGISRQDVPPAPAPEIRMAPASPVSAPFVPPSTGPLKAPEPAQPDAQPHSFIRPMTDAEKDGGSN